MVSVQLLAEKEASTPWFVQRRQDVEFPHSACEHEVRQLELGAFDAVFTKVPRCKKEKRVRVMISVDVVQKHWALARAMMGTSTCTSDCVALWRTQKFLSQRVEEERHHMRFCAGSELSGCTWFARSALQVFHARPDRGTSGQALHFIMSCLRTCAGPTPGTG